jgi:integrase
VTPAQRRAKTIKRRIDRSVPGIGRVALRTGARTIAEHRARVALFDRLIEAGQIEAIRMKVDGEITWAELRQAQRKNRLHSDTLAADVALARNLWVAIAATLKRMGKTESSRTRYELAFAQLQRLAVDFLPGNALVKDLKALEWPDVFLALHELSPASRNRVRSAVSAFLTVFLGDKFHPFRRGVMRAMGGMESEQTPPKEITVDEFWTNLAATDEAVQPIILTLAGTGMRIGEYLLCDEFSARRLPVIWIPGGKTGANETVIADALLPFARQAIPCNIAPRPKVHRGVQYDARYKRIWKAMRAAAKATGVDWSPHYLRHLYAKLATDKLPQVLAQQGLRHATGAMTAHYAKRKTTAQVATVVSDALMKKVCGKVRNPRRRNAS